MSEYTAKIDIDRQLQKTEMTIYNSDVDYLTDGNMENPKIQALLMLSDIYFIFLFYIFFQL